MKIHRQFTTAGQDTLEGLKYEKRRSVISNPDGSTVFKMEDIEVPADWSQLATDIVVSKYLRKAGVPGTGHETGVRQLVHRIAHTLRVAGEAQGRYFDTPADAQAFEDELSYILVTQRGAFNSPVWFNCGLYHAYGITGSGGNWAWDDARQTVVMTANAYERPQCAACFIQSVDDDLMHIYELVKNEARLFKYGSGTGTNFSRLRGKQERLSSGGTSSGLMSFLEVLDRGAGATKSGGTTRRAAKMVVLDMDHPEITDFIQWKVREEKKARILIEAGYENDFNGEAYKTVSGQNSNNSVRVTDDFMKAVETGGAWRTTLRTTGEVCETFNARDLWKMVADAAWQCADPGVQFDTTINKWHTCKATGRINGSNPCSEYMFLDDSACNLASINLMKYVRADNTFDIEGFRHTCEILITAQEIIVDFASYPTKDIARNSHDYRPLGLGYANLGILLMVMGLPYDSDEGRAMAAAITALMHGRAYGQSAVIARDKGPFAGYAKNRESMIDVIRMHRAEAYRINADLLPPDIYTELCREWDRTLALGEANGYRNAQATVLAPTGTIGLLMDCDTTGIEPDFALVKFKKLAGGGYFKIVNEGVPLALKRLGYASDEIIAIVQHIRGSGRFEGAPYIDTGALLAKGLTNAEVGAIEAKLNGSLDLNQAFSPHNAGAAAFERLGIAKSEYEQPGFNFLEKLGFTAAEIDAANDHICGRQTIEGAPFLKEEHLPIFDCANKCGKYGTRYIAPMGHVKMMAAVQPFLSGAISKTVNLPNAATREDVEEIYFEAWKRGLKAIAIYRDGSKSSQPLSTSKKATKEKDEAMEPTRQLPIAAAPPAATVRRRLPKKRYGFTQEARVAGHKVYLRTGEYENGELGEIFVDLHKEGASFRSLMNCFAIAVSLGLQHGVPLKEFVDIFTFTRFEPQGPCDHPNIKNVTSIVDYLFRTLGMEYLGRTDFVQVKPADDSTTTTEQFTEEVNEPRGHLPSLDARSQERAREQARVLGFASALAADNGMKAAGAGLTAGHGHTNGHANGKTNGRASGKSIPAAGGAMMAVSSERHTARHDERAGIEADALSLSMSQYMGDAPLCDVCGHVTVRNGTCYRCLNCGNSMGCS